MRKLQVVFAFVFFAMSFNSFAQMAEKPSAPKLIAVVNKASWCGVCKANADRFGAVLMPYMSNGVNVYFNDLSNETTKAASLQELQKANVYEATTVIPRKGMGKMLKACGIGKNKKQTKDVAGIVTFINPETHEQLAQVSIAESDAEMQKIINKLLK